MHYNSYTDHITHLFIKCLLSTYYVLGTMALCGGYNGTFFTKLAVYQGSGHGWNKSLH